MPGMAPAGGTQARAMQGMNMDAMMKRCEQMRQDMKPDEPISRDMRKMMADCDAMDQAMTAPAQTYTPPAERTR